MSTDFPAIIARHARDRGDVIAIELAGQGLTYRELHERSDHVASALAAADLPAGSRVAFLSRSCVEYFEFLLGAMKAGVVPVPINWRLAGPEIIAVLNDAEAALLVISEEFVGPAEHYQSDVPTLRTVLALTQHSAFPAWRDWLDVQPRQAVQSAQIDDETIVLQVYTSGTTGLPKGVMTSNAGFMSYLASLSAGARLTSNSISLSTMPQFHIGGTGWAAAGLYQGATVLMLRDADPDLILETIAAQHVTNLIAVPSVVRMLLQSSRLPTTDFSSLAYLYYGGGPMTEHILQQALAAFHCAFLQGFGMTECPFVSLLEPEDHTAERNLLLSCGKAIPATTIRLVDPETGIDVAPGAVGELWVNSPQVMAGYWKQPETTRAALVEGKWLRTGDCAFRNDEGYLFLRDRLKDMIVTGGENVYPGEVENVLVRHPGVAECAVIGVPSEKWIETVKAIVVPAGDAPADPTSLIAHCKAQLAGYKCPTSIEFVSALPRTPSGKVIKFLLKQQFGAHD